VKTGAALVVGAIWTALSAHATPLFPVNQRFEVISVDHRELVHNRTKLLFVRPAFLDNDFPFEIMDVRVATGCNNWGLTVKATQTGEFDLVFFRQTSMWCGDISEVEQQVTQALLTTRRWRMDGEVLILEGDARDLRLAPIAQNEDQSR